MIRNTNRKTGLLSTAARTRRGASGTEIGLLLGLIAIVSITSVTLLGVRISDLNNTLAGYLEDAQNTTGGSPGSGSGAGGGGGGTVEAEPVDIDEPEHCQGGGQSVEGSSLGTEGDDSIAIDGAVTGTTDLDSGNDSFSACAGTGLVKFGPGSDTATIVGTVLGVEMEDGEGVLEVKGDVDGQIKADGDSGGPTTTRVSGNVTGQINLSDRDDSVTVGGDTQGPIYLRQGVDVVDIRGNALSPIYADFDSSGVTLEIFGRADGVINLGKGDDSITVGQDAAGLNLQQGSDVVDIGGSVTGDILSDNDGGGHQVTVDGNIDGLTNLSDGDDTLTVGGDTADVNIQQGSNTVTIGGSLLGYLIADNDGSGSDVTIEGDAAGNIDLSNADDSLTIRGTAGNINTEQGSDVVVVDGRITGFVQADGDATGLDLTARDGVDGRIDMSDGNDRLEITGNLTYNGSEPALNTEQGVDYAKITGKVTGDIVADFDGSGLTLNVGAGVDGQINLSRSDDTVNVTGDVVVASGRDAIHGEQGSDDITVTGSVVGAVRFSGDASGATVDIGEDLDGDLKLSDSDDTVTIGGNMTGGHTISVGQGSNAVTIGGNTDAAISADGDGSGLDLEIGGTFSGVLNDGSRSDDRVIIGGDYASSDLDGDDGTDSVWLKSYTESDWNDDVDGIQSTIDNFENIKVGNDVVVGSGSAFSAAFFN